MKEYIPHVVPAMYFAAAVLFIVLKASGAVSLPWLWALSPLWVPIAISLLLLTAAILYGIIYELILLRQRNGKE